MIDELQIDIIRIAGSLFVGLLSKIFESVTTSYTLFALINLIALLYFAKSVINFIQDKYNVVILKFGRKTID